MTEQVDVAVIGGGIVGAACTFRLAEAGRSVTVLEREQSPAMGSTGLSAAGVRVQFVEPVNVALSLASIRQYARFPELYGTDSGYRPVGYLFLVPDEAWDAHLAGVEVQRNLDAPIEVLDIDEALARFLPFDPAGLAGATFGPIDGIVDPNSVTTTYLGLARDHGATVRLRSGVTGIAPHAGGWELAIGDDRLRAGAVVNAAGCWAGEVGRLAGIDTPVTPARRMIFLTGPRQDRPTTPLTVDAASGLYYRSEGERLLFGRSNPDEEPGFATGIDWDWLEPTMEAAMARFPWFADEELDQRASWYGYYEMTPDHNAILGAASGSPTWIHASGFSGHGVQHAAAVGEVVRDELLHGRSRSIDIDPLRDDRFADGHHRSERHII